MSQQKNLCESLIVTKYASVRLMFVLFERDLFREDSEAGVFHFTGLVYVLPDNKIVEDCHNTMKADAKKTGRSGKRKNVTLQDSLQNSKVFANRKINHTPNVSRQYFLEKYKATKVSPKFVKRYRAKNHKLPTEWKKITSRKTWKTFSEDSFRKDIAAWVWLQEGRPALAATQGITLESALFSKLCLPLMALRLKSNNVLYASLGNIEQMPFLNPFFPHRPFPVLAPPPPPTPGCRPGIGEPTGPPGGATRRAGTQSRQLRVGSHGVGHALNEYRAGCMEISARPQG